MESVILIVDEASPVVAFVEALGRLATEGMPHSAVIGGVAVMFQLAAAHRPTADIDALVRDDDVPSAVEVLIAQGAIRTAHGVEFGGVHIDLLEVGDVPNVEDLPTDELDRSFVVAHSWALATAGPMRSCLLVADDGSARVADVSHGERPWHSRSMPRGPTLEHVWVSPFLEDNVDALVDVVGASRVVFGSDWPHVEGLAEPRDFAMEISTPQDEDVRRIMRDNARELVTPRTR